MPSYASPARVRYSRSDVTGELPDTIAPGSFAINWADRKLYVGLANNQPMLLSQFLQDWASDMAYYTGDFVLKDQQLYRARNNISAGTPFSLTDWEQVATNDRALYSEPMRSNLISGGVVTQVDPTTIAITAGSGLVVSSNDPSNIQLFPVEWSGFSPALTYPGSSWAVVGLDRFGGLSHVPYANFDEAWRRDHILLAYIAWITTGIIAVHKASVPVGDTASAYYDEYIERGGSYRTTGMLIFASNLMHLKRTAGVIFDIGGGSPTNPNSTPYPAVDPLSFLYSSPLGLGSSTTNVDPSLWYNGTSLVAVPAGKVTIQYLSLAPDGTSILSYGDTLYNSISEALPLLADNWASQFSLSPMVPLCAIVVPQGTTLLATQAYIALAAERGSPYDGTESVDTTTFLLLDGSRAMLGALNMGGYNILSSKVDGSGNLIAPARITAANTRPSNDVTKPYEIIINDYDRKVYQRNASGVASTVADRIMAYDVAKSYDAGDLAIQSSNIWQAQVQTTPGAFNPAQWVVMGSASSSVMLVPPSNLANTINTTTIPAATALKIQGAAAQIGNLLEIPGTVPADGRSLVVDQYGFPNARLGPVIQRIAQATHGFSYIGQALAHVGGVWVLADGSNSAHIVTGVVEQIIDANTFVIRYAGSIASLQTAAFTGGTIVANTRYYLSPTIPGQLTSTPPGGTTTLVLVTTSTTTGVLTVAQAGSTDLPLSGGTMTGPITMGVNVSLRFEDVNTRIQKRSSITSEIDLYVNNAVAARIEAAGTTLTYSTGVITMEKGDFRYYTKAAADALLATKLTQAQGDARYLQLTGGTLTGALAGTSATFSGQVSGITPSSAANLTRKDYVDGQVATRLTQAAGDARYLQLSGGTMTGTLTVPDLGFTSSDASLDGSASHNLSIVTGASGNGTGYAFYGGAGGGAATATTTSTLLSRKMGDARYLQLTDPAVNGPLGGWQATTKVTGTQYQNSSLYWRGISAVYLPSATAVTLNLKRLAGDPWMPVSVSLKGANIMVPPGWYWSCDVSGQGSGTAIDTYETTGAL